MAKYKKEELEKLIFDENLTYEEIGRKFSVSGNAIKNAAKRAGIDLPKRRTINEKETFGRGKYKYERAKCIVCGKEFIPYPQKSNLFCSQTCQCEQLYQDNIKKWIYQKKTVCFSKSRTSIQ